MKNGKEEGKLKSTNEPSYVKKVLISAGIFIPLILLLLLFGVAFKLLLLILASVLFASFFRGIAGYIQKFLKIPIGWSLLVSVVLVIGIFTLFAMYIGPQISEQISQLSEKMPETIKSVKEKLEEYKGNEDTCRNQDFFDIGRFIGAF